MADPKPAKRRVRIAIYVTEEVAYSSRSLADCDFTVELPASLDIVLAQLRAQVIQAVRTAEAISAPVVPPKPVPEPLPADLSPEPVAETEPEPEEF